MRVVDVDKFCRHIAPMAENCPGFVVREAVISTISDMCKRTGCVTAQTCIDLQPGVSSYEVSFHEGICAEIVRYVFCDGCPIESKTLDELARIYHGADWAEATGEPKYYSFKRPGTITFTPAPSAEGKAKIIATASVSRSTNLVPEEFYTDYLDTVVDGALSRIYRVAGQTYTNVRLADDCALKYSAGISEMRVDVCRDFSRSTGVVSFKRIV